MITEYSEERQKSLILDYFSRDARIRLLRRAETFGAPVFVVDFDRGSRHFRTLGSFGAGGQVTEQSSMDLLYPARLVFHYERLMSLAFAMVVLQRLLELPRYVETFPFDKASAAHAYYMAVNADSDAVAHPVLRAVGLRQL